MIRTVLQGTGWSAANRWYECMRLWDRACKLPAEARKVKHMLAFGHLQASKRSSSLDACAIQLHCVHCTCASVEVVTVVGKGLGVQPHMHESAHPSQPTRCASDTRAKLPLFPAAVAMNSSLIPLPPGRVKVLRVPVRQVLLPRGTHAGSQDASWPHMRASSGSRWLQAAAQAQAVLCHSRETFYDRGSRSTC